MGELPSATVQRVEDALAARGLGGRVVDLGLSARTATEAARAVGCRVDQIAKSLVFRLARRDAPLLVIVSGANRVNERSVAALVGEPLAKADADFVRARTGFAIGGVAPVGHLTPVETLIDQDLLRWDEIWAAAGHPNTVFRCTPAELLQMTGGRVAPVA